MERARLLFGCYRRGDANDPETYVMAVSAILARFPVDLIREVTDPNSGIQTSEKYAAFMPNAGEVKVYCDGVAARAANIKRLGALPPPERRTEELRAGPGDLASIFVPADHADYDKLVALATASDARKWRYGRSSDNCGGIWVSWDVFENSGVRWKKG